MYKTLLKSVVLRNCYKLVNYFLFVERLKKLRNLKKIKLRPLPVKKIIIASFLLLISIILLSTIFGREIYGLESASLLNFALVHFAGYLFFIIMPVEIVYLYVLNSGVNFWLLLLISLATAVVAQSLDYLIGRLLSDKIIEIFIGKRRHERIGKYIEKYGSITVFVFNLLPLSSPIVALVTGMLRFSYKRLLVFMTSGLILKYLVLTLFFS